ncbi:hypothetical protein NliqN6_6300 [Naganishia liquefaciens]|uniref:Palmitoyltransferase n=1 Tax=Naganishia liquefaciens TaxID=104408 RepID=A0A8H3TZY8_9TREE|nr:hypothetical protein NliqN6_6300 [Naganishia liquefaciens]
MPVPALLHVRPWLRRSTRTSPPSSPRTERVPAIGNLEDVVGAVERWWGEGRERTAVRGWRGWVSRAPLMAAFSILGLTYVPFVAWVGHDQLYLIYKQGWRYLAVLVAYHTLLGMTSFSLVRASTIPPGSPARRRHPVQPDSEDEADFRGISVAEWRHRRGEKPEAEAEDDDLPLSAIKAQEVPASEIPEDRIPLNSISPYPPPSVAPISAENRLLRRWCKECQGWKPPRCHHCRTCGVCVLKMDHHCIWLITCVGYANHKAFLLFLLYATALSALVAEETGYVIWRWLDGGQVVDITDFRPVANLLLCIIAITFFLSIGSFFCFHVYLAMNNRTTLENLRPCLPPAALIEAGPATPPSETLSSPSPDAPPTYSPEATISSPTPHSTPSTRPPVPQTRRYHWQWRWKPDHLLTRNERKLVRHVAQNVNIYDRGDAWSNLLAVVERQDEDADGDADVEMGGTGRRRVHGYQRVCRWFWPSAIGTTWPPSSVQRPASHLPGHDFPISAPALDTIRFQTYGLRTRRRIALRRHTNLDDSEDDDDQGFARSSNEYEFDSEEGYEADEIEEYGMI